MLRPRLLIVFISVLLFAGCEGWSKKPSFRSLDEAHQKFIQFCEEDKIAVHLKPLDNTLWIYIPVEESLLEVKATGFGIQSSSEEKLVPKIKYLDTTYHGESFEVTYHVAEESDYPKDLGYGMPFREKFSTYYQAVFNNIYRTYLEADAVPGERPHPDKSQDRKDKALAESYLGRVDVPEFFVLVFADIQNGLEVKVIFAFEDYKKEVSQAMALDESQKRRITEFAGNKNMIGDRRGEYLEVREITRPEFLSKQITQRVNLRYSQSVEPPDENPEKVILEEIAKTVKIYQFEDFKAVYLNNLRADHQEIVKKSFLDDYDITDLNPKGKIHTLQFNPSGKIISDTTRDVQ